MKKQNIILSFFLIVVTLCFCGCGNSIKFNSSYAVYNFGKNYAIPCNTKNATFKSSNEEVFKIENNKIVPVGGGYAVLSADDSANMVVLVTGITHSRNNIKVVTKSAKITTNAVTMLELTLTVENLGNENFAISATNFTSFSVFVDEENENASSYARLSSDTTNLQDIIITPSSKISDENKKATEIVVYFKVTNMSTKITSSSENKYFFVEFNGLKVGALKVTDWSFK